MQHKKSSADEISSADDLTRVLVYTPKDVLASKTVIFTQFLQKIQYFYRWTLTIRTANHIHCRKAKSLACNIDDQTLLKRLQNRLSDYVDMLPILDIIKAPMVGDARLLPSHKNH